MMPCLGWNPFFAVERKEVSTEGVERRQKRREQRRPIKHREERGTAKGLQVRVGVGCPFVYSGEDFVLAPETGERHDPR